MLLSNDEVLDLADSMLEYSDFGNFYGNSDIIVEFAYALIQKEKEKENASSNLIL